MTKPDQLELLVGFSGNTRSDWHPWGHRVSFGAVLGTNLTGDFRRYLSEEQVVPIAPDDGISSTPPFVTHSGARSFLAGPMIELQLPHQLSVEVNAIHRPLTSVSKETAFTSSYTLTTWQFPVLAKYRFAFPFAEHFPKLFVEAGPSFRLSQQVNTSYLSNYGATGGLGVETHVRALKIAPVMRYSHWGPDNPRGGSEVFRNEVQFLVGFSF